MSSKHRRWGIVALAGLAAGIGVWATQGLVNATGPKSYDPGITVGPATPGTGDAASVNGGTDSALQLYLLNTSSNRIDFNGVRVLLPASLATSAIQNVTSTRGTITTGGTGPGGKIQTGGSTGRYIEILSSNVLKDRAMTITISARIGCAAAGTSFTFGTDIRQNNDFNGTNNTFGQDGINPTATVASNCKLAFTSQPANAAPGAVITTTAYNQPAGGSIQVSVQQGGTSTAAPTTPWTTPISLGYSRVAGTGTVTFTQGPISSSANVATFGPTLSPDGRYALTATSGSLTSATSNEFQIGYGGTFDCTAGDSTACTTGTLPGPDGSTINIAVNENDQFTGQLNVDYTNTLAATFPCATPPGEVSVSVPVEFNATGTSLSGFEKVVTLTATVDPQIAAYDYEVCYVAPYDFPAVAPSSDVNTLNANLFQALQDPSFLSANGAVSNGSGLYNGFLLNCNLYPFQPANDQPCVSQRSLSGSTLTIQLRVPAGDPSTYIKR